MAKILHGSSELPSVVIDSYNLELRDENGGFIGDRGSKRAFQAILEDWRSRVSQADEDGEDPFGDVATKSIGKKKLDRAFIEGDAEAAGLLLGAVEDFAQDLAAVTRRFVRAKGWKSTERIVVGGGMSDSRLGQLAIGRAAILLKTSGVDVELRPIRHHPDEAGLIGAGHLMPSWMFEGHDSFLAVDIGGTNIRVGIIRHRLAEKSDMSLAEVWKSELWRHADEKPKPSRTAAVERLVEMLTGLIDRAQARNLRLAPFIGVGCPGIILEDGTIERGGQNLPGGNWESKRFNLPAALTDAIPTIGDHDTVVCVHNDAVVQGLSEVPFNQDVERWGVLTIGTGLGNARFTNRGDKG